MASQLVEIQPFARLFCFGLAWAWLAITLKQAVPAPMFNVDDFALASATGNVLVRLPRSVHLQMAARAITDGMSLNALVLALVAEGLGKRRAARR